MNVPITYHSTPLHSTVQYLTVHDRARMLKQHVFSFFKPVIKKKKQKDRFLKRDGTEVGGND